MFGKFIIGMVVLMAAMFLATENSYAQGNICLLGVGNCPQGPGNNGNAERGGRRYLEGNAAAEYLRFKNYGARYLLVLSSTYDGSTGCSIEIRAWVSGTEAQSADGRLMVTHGPTRTVYVCNGTMTAQQVNQTESYIAYSRKWIYELQTNPSRYPNSAAWINYYTEYIKNSQAAVAQVTP